MVRALTLLLHIPLLQNRTYIEFMQKPIRVILVGFACGNFTLWEVHKRSGIKSLVRGSLWRGRADSRLYSLRRWWGGSCLTRKYDIMVFEIYYKGSMH